MSRLKTKMEQAQEGLLGCFRPVVKGEVSVRKQRATARLVEMLAFVLQNVHHAFLMA